jgi:hypothetical protein
MDGNVDKDTFLAAVQCLTQGWYVKHAVAKPLTPGLRWRFFAGTDAQTKARAWLGPGRMLRRTPRPDAIAATIAALADPDETLLFEASFQAGGCVGRADALRRDGDGWELLEIKSGTKPDEQIDDIAYTACVATSAGLPLTRAVLVLINREYRLDGPAPMFVEIDVTEEVRLRMADFQAMSAAIVAAATSRDRPTPKLELVCKKCDFFESDCLGVGVSDSILIIPRISAKKFGELRAYERIGNLPASADLTEIQQAAVDVIRSGKPRIDEDGLSDLDSLEYPVHYLDFETVSPHLPWFADRPPYDATAFQYSLHVRTAPGASVDHRGYLAPLDGDWRKELVTGLLTALGDRGAVMVYSHYEQTQLRALAGLFPDLAPRIDAVIERLFDLEKLIKRGYAHPRFGGQTSIKKVLPVVAPDLSYVALDVSNGSDASGMFGLMKVGRTSEELHSTHRAALQKYCEQDTLAMVRIHDFLMGERSKLR